MPASVLHAASSVLGALPVCGPTCNCVHLAASFDDSVLPLAFLSAKTRPESAEHAPRAAAAEPALASDPFSQGPAAEAIRFRTPTLQEIVFAAMRPLLQRRAAARLAAALLTPFIPELRQQPALAISVLTRRPPVIAPPLTPSMRRPRR